MRKLGGRLGVAGGFFGGLETIKTLNMQKADTLLIQRQSNLHTKWDIQWVATAEVTTFRRLGRALLAFSRRVALSCKETFNSHIWKWKRTKNTSLAHSLFQHCNRRREGEHHQGAKPPKKVFQERLFGCDNGMAMVAGIRGQVGQVEQRPLFRRASCRLHEQPTFSSSALT